MTPNLYKYIVTNATTAVCTGPSILHAITINTDGSGSITIQDGGVTVGIIEGSAPHGTYFYDIAIKGALTIVTASTSPDITVSYRPN